MNTTIKLLDEAIGLRHLDGIIRLLPVVSQYIPIGVLLTDAYVELRIHITNAPYLRFDSTYVVDRLIDAGVKIYVVDCRTQVRNDT